jgi:hypothetical protein
MPRRALKGIEELSQLLDEGVAALSPVAVRWPLARRGTSAAQELLTIEEARRPQTEESLQIWQQKRRWVELDHVGTYLVESRLIWGVSVVHSLQSVPVYARSGPWTLAHWVLIVSWKDYGLFAWKAQLDTWAAWYEAGLQDASHKSFAV